MASIFTFETKPATVASPWPQASPKPSASGVTNQANSSHTSIAGMTVTGVETLAGYNTSKLQAEPQDGPVEYKLHLLLRPRRTFLATSTVQKISGSYLSKSRSQNSVYKMACLSRSSSPALAPSNHSRQNRLQHLTTQLLWRMQKSSPHHGSSKSDLVLP